MKPFLLIIFSMVLCCGVINGAVAKAPVWKVSKGGNTLFLGGTIHVLSTSDYPLPNSFDSAFEQSQQVVFEVDIAQMSDPLLMQEMGVMLTFQGEQTLQSALSKQTYARLETYLTKRDLSIDHFKKLKPIGISLSLLMLEMQNIGLSDGAGVDQFYYQRAAKEGKDIAALETLQEQMTFIAQMGAGNADALVESTLQDLHDLAEGWRQMSEAWRSGDTANMHELLVEPMQEEFPSIYRLMLLDRNNNWMKKIIPMFSTKEIEFVLVGALHMVGKDGLLEQLRERGYTIQQLD